MWRGIESDIALSSGICAGMYGLMYSLCQHQEFSRVYETV